MFRFRVCRFSDQVLLFGFRVLRVRFRFLGFRVLKA